MHTGMNGHSRLYVLSGAPEPAPSARKKDDVPVTSAAEKLTLVLLEACIPHLIPCGRFSELRQRQVSLSQLDIAQNPPEKRSFFCEEKGGRRIKSGAKTPVGASRASTGGVCVLRGDQNHPQQEVCS